MRERGERCSHPLEKKEFFLAREGKRRGRGNDGGSFTRFGGRAPEEEKKMSRLKDPFNKEMTQRSIRLSVRKGGPARNCQPTTK